MTDAQHAERRKWIALALLASTQFVIILDAAIVNVAIPSIGRDLDFAQEDLAWIPNAYALTFGGFLLLGGRMADLLGRRRLFMGGLVVFVIASLLGGFSQSEGQLIAARALQGLGAALLAPSALSMVTTIFAEGAERNKALGVWGAVSGSGGAAGVLLGGVADRVRGLGVGAVGQRPDRPDHRVPRAAAARREHGRVRDAPFRRARRDRRDGRAVAARVRARRHRSPGLGLDADDHAAGRLDRADRCVRHDRAPLDRPARAVSDLPPAHADRRERHQRDDGRGAVLDVLLPVALHAGRARVQRAEDRPVVPAAGARDHRLGWRGVGARDEARLQAGADRAGSCSS